MKTGHMRELHTLLTRYHGSWEGNNFLLMKRSAQKPNRVSQEITGLKAGQCYSMKMFVADHQDLLQAKSEKKRMMVAVNIENAEMIPAKSFIADIKAYWRAAQYVGKEPPCMNYHRHVFRAKGLLAHLTISDWADPSVNSGQVPSAGLINSPPASSSRPAFAPSSGRGELGTRSEASERAKAGQATTPGGPAGLPTEAGAAAQVGQETLINFIEIQPYLDD